MANRLDYTYRRLVHLLGPDRVARGRFETFVYGHDFAARQKHLAPRQLLQAALDDGRIVGLRRCGE